MDNYLEHHGILGQRWGVRRYQNPDGTLTSAGKKRYSEEYKKNQELGDKQLASNYNKLYVDAYNKSADKMNNGEIDKFNSSQKKKYGKDFAERDDYEKEYEELFNGIFQNNLNKSLAEFIDNNEYYKKAKDIVKKYNMTEWDSLAKENSEIYDNIHRNL